MFKFLQQSQKSIITALDGMCEDTINIVKSTGEINKILVNNAYSDALDTL